MAGTPHRMWWWWGTWIFACHNRWMGPRASFAAGNFRRNFEDPTWLWGLTFPTVRSSPRLREACGHRRSSPWMSGLEILRVSTEGQAISGFLFLRGSERSAGDLTHTPHPPNPSCTVSFFFFFALFGNLSLVSLMAKEMFYGAPQKKKHKPKCIRYPPPGIVMTAFSRSFPSPSPSSSLAWLSQTPKSRQFFCKL